MNKEVLEIKVNKDGSYTLLAKEGFAGESCRDKTMQLEMALAGNQTSTKNTDDYFKGDGMDINLDLGL